MTIFSGLDILILNLPLYSDLSVKLGLYFCFSIKSSDWSARLQRGVGGVLPTAGNDQPRAGHNVSSCRRRSQSSASPVMLTLLHCGFPRTGNTTQLYAAPAASHLGSACTSSHSLRLLPQYASYIHSLLIHVLDNGELFCCFSLLSSKYMLNVL